jgi:hypothetical protein
MTNLSSPNNVQGRQFMAFVAPSQACTTSGGAVWPQTAAGTFTAVISETALLQLPYLADVPASKLYAEARYLPSDDISRCYESQSSVAVGTLRGPLAAALPTYGGFCGIWDGAQAVSQLIEVNIWENYECIPVSSLVGLSQPTASLSDPIEMAVASNAISSFPQIAVEQSLPDALAGTAQVSATPGTLTTSVKGSGATFVDEDKSPSLMQKLLGGIGAAVDVGKKVLPIAAELGAML